MQVGHFYFLKDIYYEEFNDSKLMKNHESINGSLHDRPCYCCLKVLNDNIYWGIPISSQVTKYKEIYEKKVLRYGKCDTIVFGNVLGVEKAFLIQNMCPITDKYIKNEYINSGIPVVLDNVTSDLIQKKATKVLTLLNHNVVNLIFPDVKAIENRLNSTDK